MENLKRLTIRPLAAAAIILLAGGLLAAQAAERNSDPGKDQRPLAEKVRHELAMQPRYTVFDNITYAVDGDTVTLGGQVTRPIVKDDAGRAVKHIAGVSNVVNNIEVLPPSPMDDRIRRAEFRSIFSGAGPLSRYGWGPVPPIHIVVESGRVTLDGTVETQTDKNMATLLANQVPGVFSVQNNLNVKHG